MDGRKGRPKGAKDKKPRKRPTYPETVAVEIRLRPGQREWLQEHHGKYFSRFLQRMVAGEIVKQKLVAHQKSIKTEKETSCVEQ
ncbi:hypothetical protein N9917_02320 [Deltaproteobacteria bacterium]|nr:hypothetical protein [Deltaproteobacteria bacterium]